ncbi:MAG: EutN/CcmL family microcompartment protein [Clostridia bacterium]|nr:EutN/CcmL family microcompartment protein [Clostridia bacterium]MBQ7951131.1 EutN/CcmL family microcompartment protein [Clostridia bacterium]
MVIGKVTGSIFSTRKLDSLTGSKLMVVNIGKGKDDYVVAIDTLGAGIGEMVLVTLGDSARFACQNEKTPIDAVIVGIVDESNYNQ